MSTKYKILILGASYGSLLGAKLLMAGHTVKLVCLPAESELINAEGIRIRMPVKNHDGLLELDSQRMAGALSAGGPESVNPADYDLVGLAMQEPQYRSPGVRELLEAVARAKVPCMSIMNMPPLTYLKRVPGIDADGCRSAYTDPTVWDGFDTASMTLCSPDPQAFRPPEEKVNVLQVRLPTNFKCAAFESAAPNAMLRELEAGIQAIRLGSDNLELPVKLKVHDSVFVPLAKWAMLMAGNYRCVTADGIRSIERAVHSDIAATREMYQWVVQLCTDLGANPSDLVPFEKYANAALSLQSPSSAARALGAGALNIERVDRLVQLVARQKGRSSPVLDETVRLVDEQLESNRASKRA
ncbi:MAG: hypothetical protein ABIU58_12795 [Ramlibacter sp.]